MKRPISQVDPWPAGVEFSLEIELDMNDPATKTALEFFARCPWLCPQCKALSSYAASNCQRCGAARPVDDDDQEDA